MKLTTFVEHFYIFKILISNSIFTKENYPNFTFFNFTFTNQYLNIKITHNIIFKILT